ncbi:MAG: hypothetical protein ACF8PN_08135 [Phycisphaerales bacterium]
MTTPPLEPVIDVVVPSQWFDVADTAVVESTVDVVVTTPWFDAVGPLPDEPDPMEPPVLTYTAVASELDEELTDELGRSLLLEPDPLNP